MKKKKILLIILIVIILFILYLYFGNTLIQVNKINVIDNNIPKEFDGYKIIQVSDLHNIEFGSNQKYLISKIKENSPDIIVVTGDLIDSFNTNVDISMNFINEAIKVAPIYYVTGNHESRIISDYNDLKAKMIDSGVIVLENEKVLITKSNESISIIGVNDPSFCTACIDEDTGNYMNRIISNIIDENDGYKILLSHRPEIFDTYSDLGINLVFCGHAHGGQFRIPFIGGVIAPNQGLFPKYTSGMYERYKTKMIVSRGLGNSVIPLRVNNNPEIIVAILKSE